MEAKRLGIAMPVKQEEIKFIVRVLMFVVNRWGCSYEEAARRLVASNIIDKALLPSRKIESTLGRFSIVSDVEDFLEMPHTTTEIVPLTLEHFDDNDKLADIAWLLAESYSLNVSDTIDMLFCSGLPDQWLANRDLLSRQDNEELLEELIQHSRAGANI